MAHQIVMSGKGKKYCVLCGLSQDFEDACKFSKEKEKNEVEKAKIEVENRKVFLGTVLNSLVFFVSFLFLAVIYLGLDGVKIQFSRMVDEYSKGGLFAPFLTSLDGNRS
jgi:hypothetical protein